MLLHVLGRKKLKEKTQLYLLQKEPASKKQKIKVKSIDLPVTAAVPALSKDALNRLFEKEVWHL